MAKNTIDLTGFLSNELCEVLTAAGGKAMKSKHAFIDADHLSWAILSYDRKTIDTLNQTAQYKNTFDRVSANLGAKPIWSTKPDIISFTPEVKMAMISSVITAGLLKEVLISPLSVYIALSQAGLTGITYQSLVKTLNLTHGIDMKTENELKNVSFVEITTTPPERLNEYVERANYIDQIVRILYKDSKKNILLVGNTGIGKESTKYLLAKKALETGNIFSGSKVFSLDLTKTDNINFSQTFEHIRDSYPTEQNNRLVIYMNNVDISGNEAYKDTSLLTGIFETVRASSVWGVIPVSYTQHQSLLKNFPNIINNCEIIYMDEPDMELAEKMIEAKYAKYAQVHIDSKTISGTVSLARRYMHDTFLPENAISILDEALSQAKIDQRTEITTNDVKSILAEKTGIPLTDITSEEATDLQNLDSVLKQTVIGQDEAVEAVAKTIKRSRAGLKDPKRPIGSFLFIGPSGTGKTQLAKALAKVIYKDENAMIRLDMSEYTDAHTVDRLIGAPPGYVGYEEGGQLTNKVLKKPYSLILLDEVEKANPKVFDIFLQVLDDGRLTDGQGKTVDFKNTIIIMTSNLANEGELTKFFRPEFLNRIDQIIHFKQITVEVGKSIVRLFIQDLQNRLKEKGIIIHVSDDVINKIATEGVSETYGARPLRRMVEEKIEDPIVEKIIAGEVKPGETLQWNQI